MIADIKIDTLLLSSLGIGITSVDNLGYHAYKDELNSVRWLPGGHFYSTDYEFWTPIFYLTIAGDATEVKEKRRRLLAEIHKRKVHNIELHTTTGDLLKGQATISPLEGNLTVETQFIHQVALHFTILRPMVANERQYVFTTSQAGGLIVPYSYPLSYKSVTSTGAATITNNGTIWWYMKVEVLGPAGKIVVKNFTNGQQMIYNGGITSGQVFRAYFDDNIKYEVDGRDVSEGIIGALPQLEIGDNLVNIGVVYGAGSQAIIYYGDFYYGL